MLSLSPKFEFPFPKKSRASRASISNLSVNVINLDDDDDVVVENGNKNLVVIVDSDDESEKAEIERNSEVGVGSGQKAQNFPSKCNSEVGAGSGEKAQSFASKHKSEVRAGSGERAHNFEDPVQCGLEVGAGRGFVSGSVVVKEVENVTPLNQCKEMVVCGGVDSFSPRPMVMPLQPSFCMESPGPYKVDWKPTCSFQKVVLQKLPDGQRFCNVVNEKDAEMRTEGKESVFGNIMSATKKGKRGRKRKVIEALYVPQQVAQQAEVIEKKSEEKQTPKQVPPQAEVIEKKSEEKQTPPQAEVTEEKSEEKQTPQQVPPLAEVTEKYDEQNRTPASPLSPEGNSLFMGSHKDEEETPQSDGLDDLWKEMSFAMESSKIHTEDEPNAIEEVDGCSHSFVLRDDIGLVCDFCGIIQKPIELIFDFQWTKPTQSIRTYAPGSRDAKDIDDSVPVGIKMSGDDFTTLEVSMHPRHEKKIRKHQQEGFNFLVKNLVTDKPRGCVLAHAPGSGKTFMVICFIQSFLAKYPSYRPLVVLPKGILPIWKKEFQQWQVEDIPLYDFYSSKAGSRSQQLEVLKSWQQNKSILFLGYKQLSTIICSNEKSKAATTCQEILLKVPNLLILDEGHTPRNEETNVLESLAKIQTPRKVVLSGTLFQNHVREVFNILNLVRPNFTKTELSRSIIKRVLSRVSISGGRRFHKGDNVNAFYELVEENLQKSDDFTRKITVIQDLREMTKDVLHYYKGDFLEELPGLVDFTVVLNLTPKQKAIVKKIDKYEKFKKISVGSAIYIHPQLHDTAERSAGDRIAYINDSKVDSLLESINIRDGVKAKFFLNLLSLAETYGEKVLAFSQYILPMKFLERLIVNTKGWTVGKEIFFISGDSSTEVRELAMEQFNNSPDAKVFFGSIRACGEGISLVGASRVVILDVHLNPSVTRQAIGRAFRPGQTKKVYIYRLISADSPEEEDHKTPFTKELISKLWFEWNEYSSNEEFQLKTVDIEGCQDQFLESPILREDVKALYRR